MRPSARDVQRRLALIPYLRSKQGIAVDDVAREFNVKPRVIRKDVEQIMMTGVGAYGGDLIDVDWGAFEDADRIYLSNADFLTRPMRINSGEAAALIVALRALRDVAGHDQATVIDSALLKLQEAVDEHGANADVSVVVERVDPSVLGPVRQAVRAARRLEIVYATASRDEVSTRQVDPLRTFSRDGHEYLDAWCHEADGQRFFRIDRIERATVLDVPATSHSRVDAARTDVGFFASADDALEVELAIEPPARWIVEQYDAEILDDTTDTWRVRVVASDASWVRRVALRGAGSIRVLSPDTVRTQVAQAAAQALAAYDGTEPPSQES